MIPLGGRLAHMLTLSLITGNLVFVVLVAVYAPLTSTCVYAVRDRSPPHSPVVWDIYDASVVYIVDPSAAHTAGADGDALCDTEGLNATMARVAYLPAAGPLKTVLGTKNCKAYLWHVHLKWTLVAWLLYVVFVCMRQERRMFGVFRKEYELLSPTRYTLNYSVRVMASTVVRVPYTKFAGLMCTFAAVRRAACRQFRVDPITFVWKYPTTGLLIAAELTARLVARAVSAMTIAVVYAPCAQVYPLYVKIVEWIFLVGFLSIEIIDAIQQYPSSPQPFAPSSAAYPESKDATTAAVDGYHEPVRTVGASLVCSRCWSTVLASLFAKLLYVAMIIGGIALLLHYEHRIQVRIFGG